MPTLTRQQIADLAGVRRPVVTMWQQRYSAGANPFPTPVRSDPDEFDKAEIAKWLSTTGRGRNAEATADADFHSSLIETLVAAPEAASTLLLLHELLGEGLSGLEPHEALEAVAGTGMEALISSEIVRRALDDHTLVEVVDRVAEAAGGARRVLDEIARRSVAQNGPLASQALTRPALALLASVIEQLVFDNARTLRPWGSGGALLCGEVISGAEFPGRMAIHAPGATGDHLHWRRVAAIGARAGAETDATVLVGLWADADDSGRFFTELDDALLELGPGDAAVVVAPAALLVDALPAGQEVNRRQLLTGDGSSGYLAPLRYVCRLPMGMTSYGGRRRLALWVLAGPSSEIAADPWTVYADHGGQALDPGDVSAISGDVIAALRGGLERRAHAFLRSSVRRTEWLVARRSLAVDPDGGVVPNGPGVLAEAWMILDRLEWDPLDGLTMSSSEDPRDHSVSWVTATTGHRRRARCLGGTRIPESMYGACGPGTVGVMGEPELRGQIELGNRRVDRLELEKRLPRAQLTKRGDVVFLATTPPVARVDRDGGHVVSFPARILRCSGTEVEGRRIVAEVAEEDVGRVSDRSTSTWRLRTIDDDDAPGWVQFAERLDRRRAELRRELADLDQLQSLVSEGLAHSALTIRDGIPNKRREKDSI